MITTRQKIAAAAASLAAGAGLVLILASGNAGAASPSAPPATTPAGVVVTKSVAPGAGPIKLDPHAPRPTATITASAAPAGPAAPAAPAARKGTAGKELGTRTVEIEPGVTIPVKPGEAPTSTAVATPVAPPGK